MVVNKRLPNTSLAKWTRKYILLNPISNPENNKRIISIDFRLRLREDCHTIQASRPVKVNPAREWPLGKLYPSAAVSGRKGRGRRNISLKRIPEKRLVNATAVINMLYWIFAFFIK